MESFVILVSHTRRTMGLHAARVRGGAPEPRCYHFHVSRAGYVLVGGRSSRMGRDKALLPFGASVLALEIARAVETAAGNASLVGNPKCYGHLGYPVVADAFGETGPLGGILTALVHTRADWNLVAACDMPGLTVEFLGSLFERAEQTDLDAVVPNGPTGRMEPLCAVYHRRAEPALRASFARGERSPAAALRELRAITVEIPQAAYFQNVNTPEEWAAHAR